jgi:hypothetical protein
MLREAQMFKAADGKAFEDEEKAIEYVLDKVREGLDPRLAPMMAGGHLSANDRFKIVMALVPNAAAAESLRGILDYWVGFR